MARCGKQSSPRLTSRRFCAALQAVGLNAAGAGGAAGAAAAGGPAGGGSALSAGHSLLTQLRESRAIGRLVINLPRLLRSPIGSASDVIVRDGDELLVPKFQQEVTVIGEVQTVTSHLYRPGLSRDDYVALSGGATVRD